MGDDDPALKMAFPAKKDMQKWKVFVSSWVMLICALITVFCFSSTFEFGETVIIYFLDQTSGPERAHRPYATYAIAAALFFILYILDFSYWPAGFGAWLRRLCVTAVLVTLFGGGLLTMSKFPYLPLAMAMLLMPFSAVFLASTLFRNNRTEDTTLVIGFNFLCSSIVILLIWLLWLFGVFTPTRSNNHWVQNRHIFTSQAQCHTSDWGLTAGVYTHSDGETKLCLAAFLLWSSPLMLSGVLLFLGVFLMLLSQTEAMQTGGGKGNPMVKTSKLLGGLVGVCCVGIYSAASIGGAGMKLANVAICVYGLCIVGVILVVISLIGWQSLSTKIRHSPAVTFFEKLGSPGVDIVRAMFILAAPIFSFYVLLSFVNQIVRRMRWAICGKFSTEQPKTTPADNGDGGEATRESTRGGSRCGDGWPVTSLTASWLRLFDSWHWTKALLWTHAMVLLFWALKYGTILTNIVSNILITWLSTFPWWLTSILFSGIGLFMFLIPVVPGPVVYLTSGLLVVPIAEQAFGGRCSGGGCAAGGANATLVTNASVVAAPSGCTLPGEPVSHGPFLLACAWANLLSYVLKLVAHVLQQKLIGEPLGSRVSIRAMVSPNARLMKGIRVLLEQPGLSLAKSSIMCGGPDWPTSVLCGILKIPVCGLLLGLSPMFLMTIPTTLSGAFMNPPTPAYDAVKSFLFLIVIFVQVFFGAVMMHYISKLSDEDINGVPEDTEVAELDRKAADAARAFDRCTEFSADEGRNIKGMPCLPRFLLISSSSLLLLTM